MQMSRLRYDRLSYDTSGLLGPPGRWLLWFHGCCRSCPGCIAADWNNADAEYELSFQTLTRLLDARPDAEGITISGGEPFGQSAFLADLTEHLHRHGLGIIVYTGFTLSELRAMKEPAVERVLAVTDTLIDGPYRAELDDGKAFRGSANQVIHHLTPRYRAYFSVPAERRTTIQKNGGVYSLTGIPTERAKEEWLSLHRKFSKGEMIPGSFMPRARRFLCWPWTTARCRQAAADCPISVLFSGKTAMAPKPSRRTALFFSAAAGSSTCTRKTLPIFLCRPMMAAARCPRCASKCAANRRALKRSSAFQTVLTLKFIRSPALLLCALRATVKASFRSSFFPSWTPPHSRTQSLRR